MSKIANVPVVITEGVTASLEGSTLVINGPRGSMFYVIPKNIAVVNEDGKILIQRKDTTDDATKAMAGLARATIANLVTGVSKGFEKKLELTGVGYRAQTEGGRDLTLFVGFSHPVKFVAPDGITFALDDNTIVVSGSDKALVGDMAAKIRAVRPPEPYKGKGIKYQGERIRRKAGKAAKAVGAK